MELGRTLVSSALAACLSLAAAPALACGRPPPPPWSTMIGPDGPPIWIGRVGSIEPNPVPLRNERLLVEQSTASIALLETIQGEAPSTYEYVAATSARTLDGSTYAWCGPWMSIEPGDVVLVIAFPSRATWPSEPYILTPEYAPAEVAERLGSHQ